MTCITVAGARRRYFVVRRAAIDGGYYGHFVDKKLIERANTVLLMSILGSGLAVCVFGALSYDIAHWFSAW